MRLFAFIRTLVLLLRKKFCEVVNLFQLIIRKLRQTFCNLLSYIGISVII